jgi:hypothetical protein
MIGTWLVNPKLDPPPCFCAAFRAIFGLKSKISAT